MGTPPLILLTGEVGVGKSQLCSALCSLAAGRGIRCGGFLTRRDRDESGATLGLWLVEVSAPGRPIGAPNAADGVLPHPAGAQHRLAATGRDLGGPRVGPFSMDATVLALGIRAARAAFDTGADLVIIDEIGPLELTFGLGFAPLIPQIARHPRSAVVAVVRPSLVEALAERCAPRTSRVFEVTHANRDLLPPVLCAELRPTPPPGDRAPP